MTDQFDDREIVIDEHNLTATTGTVTIRGTGVLLCKNSCEITPDNPLLGDGYCESCHEYPEG